MAPQPGILPMDAPPESLPQSSAVVTSFDTVKTTATVQMKTTNAITGNDGMIVTQCNKSCISVPMPNAIDSVIQPSSPSSSSNEESVKAVVGENECKASVKSNLRQELQNRADQCQCPVPLSEPAETSDNVNKKEDNDLATVDRPRRILLKHINTHIICNLCMGYLIDATTIVECLHSFCRSCIMRHLDTEQYCPRCEMMININTTKPNIKSDTTLQAIVYKLVPGLYEKELMRKRAFYKDRPEEAMLATPEQRGEDTEHLIFGPTENMSLSLEYADIEKIPEDNNNSPGLWKPKYLQCPAIFTVAHLKKFIMLKFGIDANRFAVEIMYKVKTIVLMDHYTLMDVAYIYTWKRDAPMRFFFRVKEVERVDKKRKIALEKQNVVKISEKEGVKADTKEIGTKCESITNSVRLEELEKEKVKENKSNDLKKTKEREGEQKNDVQENSSKITQNVDSEPKNTMKNPFGEQTVQSQKPCSNVTDSNENDKQNEMIVSSSSTLSEQQPREKEERNSELKRLSPDKPLKPKNILKDNNISECEYNVEKQKKEIPPNKTESESELKTEKLKITLIGKNKHSKSNQSSESHKNDSSSSSKAPKNAKGLKHYYCTSVQKPSPEREERKVENIKLKIDLSKQNSVTIINMSGPESSRKEITKPVRLEKEWKVKPKKEKEDKTSSPKSSPSNENKLQKFEIKNSPPLDNNVGIVPPITIKAERIATNPKKSQSPAPTTKTKKEEHEKDDEEKKSEFLNSFSLAPIKPLNSPEKADKVKVGAVQVNIKETLTTANTSTPPATLCPPKITQPLKRKSKDTSKSVAKKTKIAKSDNLKAKNADLEASCFSFKLASYPIGGSAVDLQKKKEDDKLMPAPPPLKMLNAFKKSGVKSTKNLKGTKNTAGCKTKLVVPLITTPRAVPPGSLTPHPMIPPGIASSKTPITNSGPGNRTPIARRYPPILPKSPKPNPFANIPTDVNKLLQNTGTEIKQITSSPGKDVKVYGPPPIPQSSNQKISSALPQTPQQNVQSISNTIRPPKTQNPNNYLNYALFNASKARLSDVSLGCRTPIYAPNSPIYSPNSPQYMPNYNISTQPTYKYTKSPSAANNFLQSVLGQNNQLSNLFPAPPIKKPPESPTSQIDKSKSPSPENDTKRGIADDTPITLKRPYQFSNSPPLKNDNQEPPEKQVKVQTLLNSCNINIPSSLSITITNEDADSGLNRSSNLKHKSPVNNYIEILKLPDNQPISPEKSDQKKCNAPPSAAAAVQLKHSEEPKVPSTSSNVAPPMTSISNPLELSTTKTINASSSKVPSITVKSFATMPSSPRQPPSLNPIDKNPNQQDISKLSNNNDSKTKKTPSPDKKSVEKVQKKSNPQNATDIQKNVDNNESTAHTKPGKPLNDVASAQPLKKFRHILPREMPTKSANKSLTPTPSPSTAGKNNSHSQHKTSPPSAESSTKKTANNTSNNSSNSTKKAEEILDLTSSNSSNLLNSPKSSQPIPNSPTIPSDITAFLSESLLRAQLQAASNNANGIFIPHLAAAASFNPHYASVNFGYNIQQAYLMENISRMQKAGHEALEKYMQKVKASGNSNSQQQTNSNSPSNTSSPGGEKSSETNTKD